MAFLGPPRGPFRGDFVVLFCAPDAFGAWVLSFRGGLRFGVGLVSLYLSLPGNVGPNINPTRAKRGQTCHAAQPGGGFLAGPPASFLGFALAGLALGNPPNTSPTRSKPWFECRPGPSAVSERLPIPPFRRRHVWWVSPRASLRGGFVFCVSPLVGLGLVLGSKSP